MRESSPEFAEHFRSQDESPEAGNCPRGSSIESRTDMASPLVRVRDLLRAGGGPKGTDRVRPENKMDLGHSG